MCAHTHMYLAEFACGTLGTRCGSIPFRVHGWPLCVCLWGVCECFVYAADVCRSDGTMAGPPALHCIFFLCAQMRGWFGLKWGGVFQTFNWPGCICGSIYIHTYPTCTFDWAALVLIAPLCSCRTVEVVVRQTHNNQIECVRRQESFRWY